MIHSSAPGKLMLFGEHSVVYGNPCIATSINKRLDVYLDDKKNEVMNPPIIDALGIRAKFPSDWTQHKFLNLTIAKFFEKYGRKNFELTTKPIPKGLGSSSAVVAAAVKALSVLYNLTMMDDEIFKFSYEIVKEGQNGKASGYDIAVAVYGGTIMYENKYGCIKIKKLTNIKNLIAIDTGVKSSTTDIVREISEKKRNCQQIFDGIFKIINKIVDEGEKKITNENYEGLGELMNINHGMLYAVGVSSVELEKTVFELRKFYKGAKLCGKGRGGIAIGLKKITEQNPINLNFIDAKICNEGVRIEK